MNENQKPQHTQVGRLFNYANNPITITGAILATLAALLISIFVAIHLFGGHQSAYTGILAFAILPAIFVSGLLIIPVGMWFRRRKLIAAHVSEAELDAFPRLDFNDPHLRRVVLVVIILIFEQRQKAKEREEDEADQLVSALDWVGRFRNLPVLCVG